MRIFHVPNDCSATWHLPFLAWGGVWATTGAGELRPWNSRLLSPKTLRVLGCQLLGLLFNYSGCGTYSQATPQLLNSWNSDSRDWTTCIVSSIYLALKTNSVQLKMLLCIYTPLDLLKVIAPVSEVHVSSCDYSNHLHCKVFISSSNAFDSSTKRVCLQRQNCSSRGQNVFITSYKHVCLQCDSYLEVSNKDYLVASDERVRLQCEIIFGGE